MAKDDSIQNTLLDVGVPLRKCRTCGHLKSIEEFVRARGRRGGPVYTMRECKPCAIARNRDWCKSNAQKNLDNKKAWAKKKRETFPDEVRQERRHKLLKLKYKMSPHDYEEMKRAQCGCCAVCRRPETEKTSTGDTKPLSVDHDHATGHIRALLCNKCNNGIGRFDDDATLLRAAADYIELHHKLQEDDSQ